MNALARIAVSLLTMAIMMSMLVYVRTNVYGYEQEQYGNKNDHTSSYNNDYNNKDYTSSYNNNQDYNSNSNKQEQEQEKRGAYETKESVDKDYESEYICISERCMEREFTRETRSELGEDVVDQYWRNQLVE